MKLAKLITPEGDKVLVLPKKQDDKTESGIITQANPASGKKPQMGEVLAISAYLSLSWATPLRGREFSKAFQAPEHKCEGLSTGDTVLFAEYAGDDVKLKDLDTGEMVLVKILPIENILGIVTDPVV